MTLSVEEAHFSAATRAVDEPARAGNSRPQNISMEPLQVPARAYARPGRAAPVTRLRSPLPQAAVAIAAATAGVATPAATVPADANPGGPSQATVDALAALHANPVVVQALAAEAVEDAEDARLAAIPPLTSLSPYTLLMAAAGGVAIGLAATRENTVEGLLEGTTGFGLGLVATNMATGAHMRSSSTALKAQDFGATGLAAMGGVIAGSAIGRVTRHRASTAETIVEATITALVLAASITALVARNRVQAQHHARQTQPQPQA